MPRLRRRVSTVTSPAATSVAAPSVGELVFGSSVDRIASSPELLSSLEGVDEEPTDVSAVSSAHHPRGNEMQALRSDHGLPSTMNPAEDETIHSEPDSDDYRGPPIDQGEAVPMAIRVRASTTDASPPTPSSHSSGSTTATSRTSNAFSRRSASAACDHGISGCHRDVAIRSSGGSIRSRREADETDSAVSTDRVEDDDEAHPTELDETRSNGSSVSSYRTATAACTTAVTASDRRGCPAVMAADASDVKREDEHGRSSYRHHGRNRADQTDHAVRMYSDRVRDSLDISDAPDSERHAQPARLFHPLGNHGGSRRAAASSPNDEAAEPGSNGPDRMAEAEMGREEDASGEIGAGSSEDNGGSAPFGQRRLRRTHALPHRTGACAVTTALASPPAPQQSGTVAAVAADSNGRPVSPSATLTAEPSVAATVGDLTDSKKRLRVIQTKEDGAVEWELDIIVPVGCRVELTPGECSSRLYVDADAPQPKRQRVGDVLPATILEIVSPMLPQHRPQQLQQQTQQQSQPPAATAAVQAAIPQVKEETAVTYLHEILRGRLPPNSGTATVNMLPSQGSAAGASTASGVAFVNPDVAAAYVNFAAAAAVGGRGPGQDYAVNTSSMRLNSALGCKIEEQLGCHQLLTDGLYGPAVTVIRSAPPPDSHQQLSQSTTHQHSLSQRQANQGTPVSCLPAGQSFFAGQEGHLSGQQQHYPLAVRHQLLSSTGRSVAASGPALRPQASGSAAINSSVARRMSSATTGHGQQQQQVQSFHQVLQANTLPAGLTAGQTSQIVGGHGSNDSAGGGQHGGRGTGSHAGGHRSHGGAGGRPNGAESAPKSRVHFTSDGSVPLCRMPTCRRPMYFYKNEDRWRCNLNRGGCGAVFYNVAQDIGPCSKCQRPVIDVAPCYTWCSCRYCTTCKKSLALSQQAAQNAAATAAVVSLSAAAAMAGVSPPPDPATLAAVASLTAAAQQLPPPSGSVQALADSAATRVSQQQPRQARTQQLAPASSHDSAYISAPSPHGSACSQRSPSPPSPHNSAITPGSPAGGLQPNSHPEEQKSSPVTTGGRIQHHRQQNGVATEQLQPQPQQQNILAIHQHQQMAATTKRYVGQQQSAAVPNAVTAQHCLRAVQIPPLDPPYIFHHLQQQAATARAQVQTQQKQHQFQSTSTAAVTAAAAQQHQQLHAASLRAAHQSRLVIPDESKTVTPNSQPPTKKPPIGRQAMATSSSHSGASASATTATPMASFSSRESAEDTLSQPGTRLTSANGTDAGGGNPGSQSPARLDDGQTLDNSSNVGGKHGDHPHRHQQAARGEPNAAKATPVSPCA